MWEYFGLFRIAGYVVDVRNEVKMYLDGVFYNLTTVVSICSNDF